VKCRFCNSEMHEGWLFCPYCGAPSGLEFKPVFAPQEVEEEIKKLHRILTSTLGPEMRGGISIKISNVDGKPDIQVKRFGDLEEISSEKQVTFTQRVRQIPRETSEPEAVVQKVDNTYILKIKMPDVGEEDIDVMKLENSVEIRGYMGDKVYFKVFEIPINGKIIYRKLEDGVLTVKVAV
jgi:HSP20 family molecular chaperone IbpA